jgi:Sulfotransferase domain.
MNHNISGRDRRKPILVTGSHRSGTTWIGKTIAQHPSVRYVSEPFNVDHPNKTLGLRLDTWYAHYPSSPRKDEIDAAFDRLLRHGPQLYAARDFLRNPLRPDRAIWNALTRDRVLVKDPLALLSADWLRKRYGFEVVVMIRNPYAFIGSLKAAGWDFDFENFRKQEPLMKGMLHPFAAQIEAMCSGHTSDFIDRTALLWNILHAVILQYRSSHPDWLFVRHEDVALNPEAGFRRIYDHLGLDLSEQILDYIRTYTSEGNPRMRNPPRISPGMRSKA